MRIHVVSVDESLVTIGMRRMSAFIRSLNPLTVPFHVPLGNFKRFREIILARYSRPIDQDAEASQIAAPIAHAEIVAFSSMTHVAEQTKAIIRHVRRVNPRAYIIWGGIHAIMDPEDAIRHADAVCTGEGELAFSEFFEAFKNQRDYLHTRNFWFNRHGRIIRNNFRPLMTSPELEALPVPTYADNEVVYDRKRQAYRPATSWDYIEHMGLAHHTLWTLGCPFRCTYCGNSKFLENDPAYAKLRYPSPQWVANEINAARSAHPHISCVVFHDDNLLALPRESLEEFRRVYSTDVGLPFCLLGLQPNYVRRGKLNILLGAGMNRMRMGIQSGSRRILEFYNRPAPLEKIRKACNIVAECSRHAIPPAYDIIVDNPIETRQDVLDTLQLVYKLPRPFTLNIFSLRVLPNTRLASQLKERGISAPTIATTSFRQLTPTFANCLLVLLACVRPPQRLFSWLLTRVRPTAQKQHMYPRLAMVLRLVYLTKRAYGHVRFMDFSPIPGFASWLLWRIGAVRFWNARMIQKYRCRSPGKPRTSVPLPTGRRAIPFASAP
jgi:anaerobic magnesium-protoporphyrin IX monomethyl ester cyclase